MKISTIESLFDHPSIQLLAEKEDQYVCKELKMKDPEVQCSNVKPNQKALRRKKQLLVNFRRLWMLKSDKLGKVLEMLATTQDQASFQMQRMHSAANGYVQSIGEQKKIDEERGLEENPNRTRQPHGDILAQPAAPCQLIAVDRVRTFSRCLLLQRRGRHVGLTAA